MILRRVLLIDWPWALSLDEDIYNTRDLCTSHATENIDYLTLILRGISLVNNLIFYLLVRERNLYIAAL